MGFRVLLVDDEPAIRLALRRHFERDGCAVVEAVDGLDAWRSLTADSADVSFDVVICDIQLPGLNGADLFVRLRDRFPGLAERVVFTTGDVARVRAPGSLLEKHPWVLAKPFALAELRDMVRGVCTSGRATP